MHKSTVTARRPGGEVVLLPFDVEHTADGLKKLITKLRQLDGEIRIIMEHTGMYWRPIAMTLKEAGFFVSVVNAILIHNFSDNSIRKVKTDRADAMKIANYGLTFWIDLQEYAGEDENRQLLKIQSRLYERSATTAGMLRKWCKRTGYKFSASDAERIHAIARNAVATLPKNDSTKLLITQATNSLNAIYDSLQAIRTEMDRLRRVLFVIMSMTLIRANTANPVFCFMDKKRSEGKHFYVYTVAGSAKFLRIYYAKVKEYLNALEETA